MKRGPQCLVVTDGFCEWKKLDAEGKEKQPYAIAVADDAPMVMAGLATGGKIHHPKLWSRRRYG